MLVPESVRVPEPDFVNAPPPDIAPEYVELPVALTVNVPFVCVKLLAPAIYQLMLMILKLQLMMHLR